MSCTYRELQCPKCSDVCSSFSDLCNHVEQIHEMWYLNKRYQHATNQILLSPSRDQKSPANYLLHSAKNLHTTYPKVPDIINDEKEVITKCNIEAVLYKLTEGYAKLEDGVNRIYDELKTKNNHPHEKRNFQNISWSSPCIVSHCAQNIKENASAASLHYQNFHSQQDRIFSPNVSSISVKDSNESYFPRIINSTFDEDGGQFQMLTIPERFRQQYSTCPLCTKEDNAHSRQNLLISNVLPKGKPLRKFSPKSSHTLPPSDLVKSHDGSCQSEESAVFKQTSFSQTSQTDSGKGESLASKSVSYIKGMETIRLKSPSMSPRCLSNHPSSNSLSRHIRTNNSVPGHIFKSCNDAQPHDQDLDTALQLVFFYLNTDDLLSCRMVCRKWRQVSQLSSYYTNVVITNRVATSSLFLSMAESCCNMQSLTLQDIKGREKRENESIEQYLKQLRGSLELGLEALLKASQHTLMTLSIVSCGNVLTERCLWLASCYCRELTQVAYFSQLHPATPESLWSLGSGCRKIQTLIVPPLYPSYDAKRFSTRCLHMISKCWPNLRTLCVGGTEVGTDGLITIAMNCHRLKILELDHMGEVQESAIISICKAGLRALHKMYFTHTPVTPDALLHLYSVCRHLSVIGVILHPADFFTHPEYPPNVQEFELKVLKLKKLQELPGLSNVLRISVQ